MVETLVLVRHAKAQKRVEGLDDIDRKLTLAGRRSFETTATQAFSYFAKTDRKDMQIWTSPARRARQTAKIVGRVLKIEYGSIHDSIYADTPDQLVEELKQAEGCVIVVGHNPVLQNILTTLSGNEHAFGKAAVAVLGNIEPDFSHADLLWFAQGPESSRWKVLTKLEDVTVAAGMRIANNYQAMLDNPYDEEALHQYRISLRSARSLLAFIEPYQKLKQNRNIEHLLKRLQDDTSDLREYDMLCKTIAKEEAKLVLESMEKYGSPTGSNAFPRLAEAAKRQRDEERLRYSNRMAKASTRKLVEEASDELINTEWRSDVEIEGISREDIRDRFETMRRKYLKILAHTDFENHEETHILRKRAKRLRYISKELSSLLGADHARMTSDMKAVQDQLGDICDARNNQRIVNKLLPKHGKAALRQEATTFLGTQRAAEKLAVAELKNMEDKLEAAPSAPQPEQQSEM
ncbi:CHAD domain-containing protein [Slackia heliotrinireducens]|uniref:CHAD domain-containing protein n=1 Tax=Slackia heliotrinireducens TaxID=84110 RepID=UPI003315615D